MYEQIAHYYDLIHQNLKEDIEFIVKLASQFGDPVLELGCGTGRLLLPLARIGYYITGLDNSQAMLEVARQKIAVERAAVKERIELVIGDMSSFALNRSFRLIVLPLNSLMHLDRNQVGDCFHHIYQHLHKDGRLIIDVENPFISADPSDDNLLILERSLLDPETGETVLQMTCSSVDTRAQLRKLVWIFDSTPQGGGSIKRVIVEDEFHYLFAHELEIALEEVGLKLNSTYGNYHGEKYRDDSPRLLLIASLK